MNTRILVPAGLLAICALALYAFFGSDAEPRRPAQGPSSTTVQVPQGGDPGELMQDSEEADLLSAVDASQAQNTRGELPQVVQREWAEDETRWVEFGLVVPAETPVDEEVWVVALITADDNETLNAWNGALTRLHSGEDPAQVDHIYAAVRLKPGQPGRIGLPPSAENCCLVVSGKYVFSRQPTFLELPQDLEPLVLRPALGAWISGRIVPPADQPELELTGFKIKLRTSISANLDLGGASSTSLRREVRTREDGKFAFHGVPVGKPMNVSAESESLATVHAEDLKPREGEHLVTQLELRVGASIAGRLVDEAGAGVQGAQVQALGRIFAGNPTSLLRQTESDEEGRFQLQGVSPGLVMLRATHADYQDLLTPPFELVDGEAREQGDLLMSEGLVIAGSLHFPDGTAAKDASVKLGPDLSENLAGSSTDPTQYIGADNSSSVDAEGRFRIAGAGVGPWTVNAEISVPEGLGEGQQLPGRWSAAVGVIRAPEDSLELVLLPPMHVEGEVQDSTGMPISGFRISAKRAGTQWYMPPTEQLSQAFEDEAGRFRFPGLRVGEWTFSAMASGYADSEERKLSLPSDEFLSFKLSRPVVLSGRVEDPRGRPVAGAEVGPELEGAQAIEAMQGRGDWVTTTSDEEGRFELVGMPPGAGSLVAKKEGFATSEALSFEAQEGEHIEGLVLSLRKGGTITGEVFGTDGKPSGGCMVILQMAALAERRIINTDPNGRFAESGLSPGSWTVQAFPGIKGLQAEDGSQLDQAALIAVLKMTVVQLDDNVTKHVVLGEPPANPVQVSGRVSLGEAPVTGAVISFVPVSGGGMERIKLGQLDENGEYSLQLDEPDDYLVTIQVVSDLGRQNSLEFRRTVPEAESITLDFPMPLGRISGHVRDAGGNPLAGERVTLNMEGGLVFGTVFGGHYNESITNAEGAFDIGYLRPGSYSIAAGGVQLGGLLGGGSGRGRSVRSVSVDEGQWLKAIDFRLESPGSIHGTVHDANDQLVKGASIFVRDATGRLVDLFSLTETNASGTFKYEALAPGEYTLTARTGTQTSSGETKVRVEAGKSTEAKVYVEAGTILLVTLIDSKGADVPSRVSVIDAQGHELNGMLGIAQILERYSGGAGSTVQRVGPLPPGSYSVRGFAEDGRSVERTVTVRGADERKVKLRMR